MHKRWFFAITLTCLVCISLSCLWMAAPRLLAPTQPLSSAQSTDYYQLTDVGGFVWVVHVVAHAQECSTQTDIIVNLLPEQAVLQIKNGYYIADQTTLQTTLLSLQALMLHPM